MSPDQCREARAILKWTRRELANAAGVMLWVVAAFDGSSRQASNVAAFVDCRVEEGRGGVEALSQWLRFPSPLIKLIFYSCEASSPLSH